MEYNMCATAKSVTIIYGQKNYLVFLAIICFSISVRAQEICPLKYEGHYNVKWSIDTCRKSVYEGSMILYIGVNYSLFRSDNLSVPDSVLLKRQSNYDYLKGDIPFSDYIFVNAPTGKIISIKKEANDFSFFEEPRVIPNWKIHNTVKVVNGYVSALAECELEGETWLAWFSPTIPVFAGPWKLFGLPGLIIQAYDKSQHYWFDLLKIESPINSYFYMPTIVN